MSHIEFQNFYISKFQWRCRKIFRTVIKVIVSLAAAGAAPGVDVGNPEGSDFLYI